MLLLQSDWKKQLKEGTVLLLQFQLRLSWQGKNGAERNAAKSHCISSGEADRQECFCLAVSVFYSVCHGGGFSQLKMGLLTVVKPFWELTCRHTQRCVSYGMSNLVKLVVKRSHPSVCRVT